MGLFYANLWNLSSDIWDQLSEMSADFCEHCIRCRRCHDGWPVTALLTKQLRRVKHVMLTMWLPTRVRYWQVHNAIVCLARLIGALEQLISVIVVVWWHSDYGFSFWEAPMQAVCTYLSRSLLTYLYVFLFVVTLHQSKCQIKYLKLEEFEVCLASHRFLWRQWCKHKPLTWDNVSRHHASPASSDRKCHDTKAMVDVPMYLWTVWAAAP